MLLPRALRPLLVVAVAASVTLGAVGCAGPSEPLLPGGNGASGGVGGSGTPGNGGSAGASGGNPTGQGGAAAGAAGSVAAGTGNAAGGSSGSGGTAPGTGLPNVGCDYATAINKSCAITACHRPPYKIGGLDLTLDTGIKSRLVNKAATFADINCGTADNFVACVPTTCPTGALLVNTAAPEQSYILQKLDNTQGMCGIAMPTAPGDATTTGWSPDEKACLETLVRALASGK